MQINTYLHEESMIVFEDGSVILLLHRGQLHVNDGLLLRGNVTSYILFHTPQQMRCDATLQLLDL